MFEFKKDETLLALLFHLPQGNSLIARPQEQLLRVISSSCVRLVRRTEACGCSCLEVPVTWVFKCPRPNLRTTALAWTGLLALSVCHRVSIPYRECFSSFSTPDFVASVLYLSDGTATVRPCHQSSCPSDLRPTSRSIPLFARSDWSIDPELPEGMLALKTCSGIWLTPIEDSSQ